MPVYKDNLSNTWYVKGRYTDWTGAIRHLTKRGFALKREALDWEQNFMLKLSNSIDMPFGTFYGLYKADVGSRLKASTWQTKENIISTHILPYFQNLKMPRITSIEVMRWQNEMMKIRKANGKPLSPVYLKTMHNQLSAIFNHAVRHYKLSENPARTAGPIGEKEADEMKIWTKQEYMKFSEAIMDKPVYFYAFEVLYWCGLREGEMMALTLSDIDFKKKEISVTKTLHRVNGKDIFTDPKSKESNRRVAMPDFLCEELKEYLAMLYCPAESERVFNVSKSALLREMSSGSAAAGLNRIRVHDLRHSHVSLLIDMGYSAVAIAKRMGHKSIDITYRYAHLFPSVQKGIAEKLDSSWKEDD